LEHLVNFFVDGFETAANAVEIEGLATFDSAIGIKNCMAPAHNPEALRQIENVRK
jgi:hypothetical protein